MRQDCVLERPARRLAPPIDASRGEREAVRRWLIDHRLMGEGDTWGDVAFALLLLWTIAGIIGYAFGLNIGWWDVLGLGFPKNPRFAY